MNRRTVMRASLVVLIGALIVASLAIAWLAVNWPRYRLEFI